MSQSSLTELVLKRVQRRLTLRQISARAFRALLIFAALYAVLLLVGRLTGAFPEWFSPWSVATVPVLALLTGLLWPGRVQRPDAARAVDVSTRTDDLFLTYLTLDKSTSDYRGLVERDVEAAARRVQPAQVVPFQWERPSWAAAATLSLLLIGAFFVPTFDPFGKVASAKQVESAQKLLEESKARTEERKAQLAQKDVEKENSEEVERAVAQLKKELAKTEPQQKKQNLDRLNEQQKQIGEMYRKLNAGELRPLFKKMDSEQKFGQLHDLDKFREWQKELQQGETKAMQQALDELKQQMQQLAQTNDPVERTELERKIQKQLKEMSDFARKETGSPNLTAALQRAMEQLESAKQTGMSKEAQEALQESLEVAEQEMKMLAQSARDLKDMEKALEVISMAKKLNAEGKLGQKPGEGEPGENGEGEMSLEDYAQMYAELMAQRNGSGDGEEGDGEGSGGRGMGNGSKVDEDDSVDTKFVDEKSKSAIQKGKILMSLKTKGLSEAGEMQKQEFSGAVSEIRQNLDDAIDQEEIPPGYVEGIKKYFDTLQK
ncbi:hypothetical protein [Planctomicrobium sp. SH664]|uniref:hypothetical protein n=1 Tax=Planctomicrobium sp. SH664 TaxID=3448125 RepID=UPI003F5C2973